LKGQDRNVKIVFIYPPPWKIPDPGQRAEIHGDGPPSSGGAKLAGDFLIVPYGLLSLAAQAIAAGHQVKVFNLSAFPWSHVELLLGGLDADVFALTCFTSNRRGVNLVSRLIRDHHEGAHIVVGGPHVTALPQQTLEHYTAIDTVVIGEGEETFMELIARIESGESTRGLAGAAWRGESGVHIGPQRERIRDLDSLEPFHKYFPYNMILTSRGCPWQCTFCASNVIWGRKLSFHSIEYVLDTIATILAAGHRTITVKDDTFTSNRKRCTEICRAIRARGMNFLWSCDTRADVLDEELLREMRLAGCQVISLGVESASPEILKNIRKNVTPDQVLQATDWARKYGIAVRYYMIAGARGETPETLRQSIDFIRQARPRMFFYSALTAFPGTEDFEVFKARGRVDEEVFFRGDFREYLLLRDKQMLRMASAENLPPQPIEPTVEECQAALEQLPDLHLNHIDLGAACFRAGQLDSAEKHLRNALQLHYPLPEFVYNYLAGVSGQRNDLHGLEENIKIAVQQPNPHPVVIRNAKLLVDWLNAHGPQKGLVLELTLNHYFDPTGMQVQPIRPGPLPADCQLWSEPVSQAIANR